MLKKQSMAFGQVCLQFWRQLMLLAATALMGGVLTLATSGPAALATSSHGTRTSHEHSQASKTHKKDSTTGGAATGGATGGTGSGGASGGASGKAISGGASGGVTGQKSASGGVAMLKGIASGGAAPGGISNAGNGAGAQTACKTWCFNNVRLVVLVPNHADAKCLDKAPMSQKCKDILSHAHVLPQPAAPKHVEATKKHVKTDKRGKEGKA